MRGNGGGMQREREREVKDDREGREPREGMRKGCDANPTAYSVVIFA